MRLVEEMHDAKEYGSIIHVTPCDWDLLRRFAVPRDNDGQMRLDVHGEIEASARLQVLINIGEALAQKYHAVVTNPPYMGNGSMSNSLSNYVKKHYEDTRRDLFAVFIERCLSFAGQNGFSAMITQQAWMFINSYEKLRVQITERKTLVSMAHLGARAFEEIGGEVVQTTAFVIRNNHNDRYSGRYVRLVAYDNERSKEDHYLNAVSDCVSADLYEAIQSDYALIPKSPIAYWLRHSTMQDFKENESIEDRFFSCYGLLTGHDEGYIFNWYEVSYPDISFDSKSVEDFNQTGKKYAPLCKGGLYRKWYGNRELVVRYDESGIEGMSKYPKYASNGQARYFTEGITWAEVCMGKLSLRYMPEGNIFSLKGPCMFANTENDLLKVLGYLNTDVVRYFVQILNPTISCGTGVLNRLPLKDLDKIDPEIVRQNIKTAKDDWDAFETSFDFSTHPLVTGNRISENFERWKRACEQRFLIVQENEKSINKLFVDAYGLAEDSAFAAVSSDITIERADMRRDIGSLISYAVGCMFGRYSLDCPGIAYAGGEWDSSKYIRFIPDKDGIIPICDDEYFEDDIVGGFVRFVEAVYGKATLEENLRFIADALGGKGSSREVIRSYFINDFYADHLKVYQKRPIYWLFDSGKKNGFKCLIYMHRYQPDTIARIRTDYVHEQQSRYRTVIADLEARIANAGTGERVKLTKQLTKIQEQAEELRIYEEKIHHLADQMIRIDLDDGVKVNYAKFQDVLAKIK